MHDECAAGLYQFGEMSEALEIGLLGAVDVKMVGVGGGDDGHGRGEMMKRAVILVSLDDSVGRRGAQQEVAVIVFQHTAEKGVAANRAAVEYMGGHRRCGGLAVGAGKAEAFAVAGDETESPGALHDFKTSVAEVGEYGQVVGHGGGVYHQSVGGVAESGGYGVGLRAERDVHALGRESVGEGCGCAVISGHLLAFGQEVAFEGGHAYAAGSDEVYVIRHGL